MSWSHSYIEKNCRGKVYKEKTTLPAVVKECLISQRPYERVVQEHTYNIFSKMSKALKGGILPKIVKK